MGVVAFLGPDLGGHVHLTALHVVSGEARDVGCSKAEIDKLQVESLITEAYVFKLDVAMSMTPLLQHVPHRSK